MNWEEIYLPLTCFMLGLCSGILTVFYVVAGE